MTDLSRLNKLIASLERLSEGQLLQIEPVIFQLLKPYIEIARNPNSNFISDCVLNNLGDAIRIHHCFSNGAFSKDKFEYATEKVFNFCGENAKLASTGNPGHDITINGQKISLKTEASAQIRISKIHISKFMELGKGVWDNTAESYSALREQFFHHLIGYERIFTLRRLSSKPSSLHYEIVEIPKELLEESRNGDLEICTKSRQNLQPAYYHVFDKAKKLKYSLYFDGGGERKLQIKNLDKSLCVVHANWIFSIDDSKNV